MQILLREYGLILSLSLQWHVPYLTIVQVQKLRDGRLAELHPKLCQIWMLDALNAKQREEAIYHEFRHMFQYVYYRDLYNWWLDSSNWSTYMQYYDTVINVLEEDARQFAASKGQIDARALLDELPAGAWKILKKNGQLDAVKVGLCKILQDLGVRPSIGP